MSKTIMIQGTMSNVGKSLITAGLCRIFKQDGYSVAPFKAQNMALNSYITKDGLEMGRAQVTQSEAAKIEPHIYMNPILLKPTGDLGSQVIVNGKSIGNMKAMEYYEYKKKLIPYVECAFKSLLKEYDIVVIEGAGSPAEINLKKDDFVNMGMAKMASSPVLLVGDIDRGGVFAQLLGTLSLLEKDELSLVKGLIINKFRGDINILDPGLDIIEQRGKKPIVGVIPYSHADIDDEDSLADRFSQANSSPSLIDIAVIKLPRISNFTDFNAIQTIDGVSLRYVDSVRSFKNPDMIILPGTKNTISDLLWLRQCGLENEILKSALGDKIIFGICGGFQMLGAIIKDETGVECKGKVKGLNLIDMKTVFTEKKKTVQVGGKFASIHGAFNTLSGTPINGYEIHMGETKIAKPYTPLTEITSLGESTPRFDGVQKGNIYGTYIHGIFDNENVVSGIIGSLANIKCIDNTFNINLAGYKDKQYSILADDLRKGLNMDTIYNILNNGI